MDAWNILVEFPLILMIKDYQKSNPIRCFLVISVATERIEFVS